MMGKIVSKLHIFTPALLKWILFLLFYVLSHNYMELVNTVWAANINKDHHDLILPQTTGHELFKSVDVDI